MRDNLHPRDRVEQLHRPRLVDRARPSTTSSGDQRATRGDALAIVDPANRRDLVGSDPRRLTWRELDAEVTHLAARLLALGVRPRRPDRRPAAQHDRARRALPGGLDDRRRRLAAGDAVPRARDRDDGERRPSSTSSSPASSFGDRTPGRVDRAASSTACPSVRRTSSPSVRRRRPSCPGCRPSGAPPGARHRPARTTSASWPSAARRTPTDPNDCVTICWTSGTESVPKGVPRAHYDWLAFCLGDRRRAAPHRRRRAAQPVPDGQHGRHQRHVPAVAAHRLRAGAAPPVRPADVPRPDRAPRASPTPSRRRPCCGGCCTTRSCSRRLDLSSLTRIGSGSAPLQPAMVRGWQERFGIGVINFFGSNEGIGADVEPRGLPRPRRPRAVLPALRHRRASRGPRRVSEWYRLKLVDVATGRGHRGARAARRAAHPRAAAVRRLPARRAAERPVRRGGLPQDRRHLRDRRRQEPVPALRRPGQGPDHPRRHEHRPGRARGDDRRAPRRRRGRRRRRPGRRAGRAGRRVVVLAPGRLADARGARRVPAGAQDRVVQAARAARVRRCAAAQPGRQDPQARAAPSRSRRAAAPRESGEAFVYEAVRTPRGRVRRDGGTLAGVPAYELLRRPAARARPRAASPPDAVEDVVIGVSTTVGEQAARPGRGSRSWRRAGRTTSPAAWCRGCAARASTRSRPARPRSAPAWPTWSWPAVPSRCRGCRCSATSRRSRLTTRPR